MQDLSSLARDKAWIPCHGVLIIGPPGITQFLTFVHFHVSATPASYEPVYSHDLEQK